MEYRHDRRGIAPWVWVLIVLAAIILIFVVWWAVAAQPPQQTVVVPGQEQPTQPPDQTTQQPSEQPVVVERERPVNIYVERDQPQPNVIVVPRGEQPPQAQENLQQVNLPDRFRYQDRVWEPSDHGVTMEAQELRDTGATIQGNTIWAKRGTEQPFNEIYLETEPGSDIYIRYTPT